MAKKLTDDELKKAIIEASGDPDIKPENVILGPRRSELIEDGALVDVSALWEDEAVPMTKQVGFTTPVALTQAAWHRHVDVPEGDTSGQCKKGRLWDVLFMAAFAAKSARDTITMKDGREFRCTVVPLDDEIVLLRNVVAYSKGRKIDRIEELRVKRSDIASIEQKNRITFVVLSSPNDGHKLGKSVDTKLDLVLEGGDNLEPVMTILLHGED